MSRLLESLVLASLAKDFPNWRVEYEYGYWNAWHSNYEASWEGEEDGWCGNGLHVSSRSLEGLRDELTEKEQEMSNEEPSSVSSSPSTSQSCDCG